MEWIGTGFVLTIGGVRLRVRIALEDTPDPCRDSQRIVPDTRRENASGGQSRRERFAEDASSMN